MGRAAVPLPASVRPRQATLGGHDEVLAPAAPGRERRRNQPLVVAQIGVVEAVDVGGVEEGHPRVERGVKDPDTLCFGRTAFDGKMHPAVPDRRDGGRGGAQRPAKQARAAG